MSRTKLTQNSIATGALNANTMLAADVVGPHAIANTSTYSVGELLVGGTILLDNTGNIQINNGGTIGSTGDADAITIATGGVVTMNQIPVLSAGLNVSGGTIAGTLATAAQPAITSLGTLTALTVDNLNINTNTISATSGALNITPAGGSAIVLDGTVNVDAGVITGATSVTSTAFVGALTGNVTGNASGTAATVTTAAQPNITSLGTIAAFRSTGIDDNADALAMTIDSSENVGVGTTTMNGKFNSVPKSTFNAHGTTWAEAALSTAGSFGGGLSMIDGSAGYILSVQDSGATFTIRQGTVGSNPAERIRINSAGNVGIGTSSPLARLHVNNTASALYIGYGGNQDNYFQTNGSNIFTTYNNASEWMRITSAGKVGIGTTAPSAPLSVKGGATAATTLAEAYSLAAINIQPKSSSGYSLSIGSGPSDFPYIQMSAGGSSAHAMSIQPYGGNVGIGTTAPAVLLQVGPINSTETIKVVSASGGASTIMRSTSGTLSTFGSTNNVPVNFLAANQEYMRILTDGKVGIGTSAPNYLFNAGPTSSVASLAGVGITLFAAGSLTSSIGGVINFRPALGLTASEIHNLSIYAYDHSGDTNADGLSINGYDGVSFCTGANSRQERMRITAAGLVGIGIAAPIGILNVKGTGGDAMPATSGSTQSAGLITRLQQGGGIGSVMDIGGNGGSGSWIQVTESGNLATNYKLLLNPNGGYVGIGTTAPANILHISNPVNQNDTYGNMQIHYTGTNGVFNSGLTVKNHHGTSQFMQWASYGLRIGSRIVTNSGAGDIVFTSGNDSEKMRITSVGKLLIGTTSVYSAPKVGIGYAGGTDNGIVLFSSTSSSASCISFFVSNTTHVGNITTNGSSSTSYNTSSDYRLKENVEYDWDATTRLKQLKPARFNFLADPDNTVDGFMAHEAQEVVPESVTGFKDEVDDEGKPVMQGIDQAKLVPLLVKTILELEARITALEG